MAERIGVSEFVVAGLVTVKPVEPVEPQPPPPVEPEQIEQSPVEREQDAQGTRLANPPPSLVDAGDVSGDGQGD